MKKKRISAAPERGRTSAIGQRDFAGTHSAIINALPAHIALLDATGAIVSVNDGWRLFAEANALRSPDFCLGQNYITLCESATGACSEEAVAAARGIRDVIGGARSSFSLEYPCHSPGQQRWYRLMVSPLTGSELDGVVVMHVDITERKLAEDALRESELRFRGTFEQAAVGIAHISVEGRFLRVNNRLSTILGYTHAELLDLTFVDLVAPEDLDGSREAHRAMLAGELDSYAAEKRYVRKGGDVIWVNLATTLKPAASSAPAYFISIFEDIMPRKQAEFRLHRLNRLHTVLSKVGETIVRSDDRRQLFDAVCRIIVEDGLLPTACIFESDTATHHARLVSAYGQGLDYLRTLDITTDGGPLSRGTVGTALRTGRHDVCNDFVRDPRMAPWMERAVHFGIRATATFPLRQRGAATAALVLFAAESGYFQDDEVRLMAAVSDDLSFAIEGLEKERQRHEAEAALRSSEERFSSAFEYAAIGMALVGPEGRFLKVNRALCQMLGYSAADVLARTFQDITHPDDLTVDLAFAKRLLEGAIDSYQLEKRYLHRDGHVVRVLLSVSLVRDESGQPVHFVGQVQDITERRQAEESLRLQANMLDTVGQAVIATDTTGKVIYANRFAGELYGWTPEDMLGKNILDVTVTEADQDVAQAIMAQLQRGESWSGEFLVHHRSGRVFPTFVTNSPLLGADGRLSGIIGISTDISERREAETRVRHHAALLTMASRVGRLGAWAVELPSLALTWSEEVRAIHEVAADFIPGVDTALEFYAPEYRGTMLQAIESCTRDGTPFDLELEIITARGRRVWVRSIGEADRSADGTIQHIHGAFQDISDRKQAEEETRLLAERLTTTLESLTDGFYTVDRDWRFTYVNHETERTLGRTRDEMLGQVIWDLFSGTKNSVFHRAFEHARNTNVAVQLEDFSAVLGRWYEVRIYPSPQGLAVYFRDVSEQRKAREALLVSEERFRVLARATNDAIWDWDLTTNAVWWNEGFETLFGYRRDQVAPTADGWSTLIHPDDHDRVVGEIHRCIDTASEQWSAEYRFRHSDGHYTYVLDRGHVLRTADGKPTRMIGGVTDLTQLKQDADRIAEQAALLNAASDAIILKDLDGRIQFWNDSAGRIFGWTAAEIAGQNSRDLLHADPARFDAALAHLLAHDHWRGELERRTKDARTLTMDVRWTLVRDARGEPKSILSINTDVTERKQMEQQLLRVQRMESIGTLAGGIAHDLNNILAPILMSVRPLQREVMSEGGREMLATILTCSQRGAELVRQVLSFARGVEGQRILVSPIHLVRDIQKIIRETFPKNIVFTFRPAGDLWTVTGDPTQLHQVFMNLCVNARDAMPNGGKLSVTMENVEIDEVYAGMNPEAHTGSHVRIQFVDTGIGIPAGIRDRIFEPFFTTKEIGHGTGLGLSTTLAIVRSHGGFITVNSVLHEGTTFQVHLPANTSGTDAGRETSQEAEPPRGRGEMILVVDDEESIRHITRDTLERFGYRVVAAANGAEAIGLFAQHRDQVAVVLTDMVMPVMDGPATIAALRAISPTVRIIGSSGLASRSGVAKATGAGIRHFIPKPYTAERLLNALRDVLDETPPPDPHPKP